MPDGDYNSIDSIMEVPLPDGSTLYVAGQITNWTKCRFEDWLEGQARKRPFDLRDQLTTQELKESLAAVVEASAARKLAWGGEAFRAALSDAAGVLKMLVLLTKDADRRMKKDQGMTMTKMLHLCADPAMKEVMTSVTQQVLKASQANFFDPPIREGES